jgi:hypothetical protein
MTDQTEERAECPVAALIAEADSLIDAYAAAALALAKSDNEGA